MILNRAKAAAEIYSAEGYDEYGTRATLRKVGECDIYITIYSQTNTADARFKDVTHVGYTDKTLYDNMTIKQHDKSYKVLIANNEARRTVVFLREV